MRSHAVSLLVLVLCLTSLVSTSATAPTNSTPPRTGNGPAPILTVANSIDGAFIVQVENTTISASIQANLQATFAALTGVGMILPVGLTLNPSINFVFSTALIGFAVKINIVVVGGGALPASWTPKLLFDLSANTLANIGGVLLVELDATTTLSQTIASESLSTDGTLWGLDRADQRPTKGDNLYYYNNTAPNVHVYVIDTGIRKTHVEFEGRATWDYDAFNPNASPVNASDGHGHGSHVAGTVGGKTYGIAKKVNLHAVRVLDASGSGTNSGVIAGVDFVAKNHQSPAVAVMSLGGSASSSLDSAVKSAASNGVVVVVAAGNSNADACNTSPARAGSGSIITVSATDNTDRRASFSNYGNCSNIFAPGVNILSVGFESDTATKTLSGTSMATPHVGGAMALYLQNYPNSSPDKAKSDLICFSTKDAVTDVQGTPNRLLFTFIRQNGAAASSNSGSSDQPPANTNNQNEQCTNASPCQGPYSTSISTKGQQTAWVYNATGPGNHRGWLNYNTNGGSVLNPQTVQNNLYLYQWSDSAGKWNLLASDTDSNNAKSLLYSDSTTAAGVTNSFAWTVEAKGYTPTSISFTYKLPTAPDSQSTNDNTPSLSNICSATTYYDPIASNPNNPGQNPSPQSAGNNGKNAAGALQPAFWVLISACLIVVRAVFAF